MKRLLIVISSFFLFAQTNAQGNNKWSLSYCIAYAISNNISVRQADVNARIESLRAKQAKLYRYPTANLSSNLGFQLGRSIDPTTNQFTNTKLLFQQYNFNLSVPIVGWGKIKYNIQAAQINAAVAEGQTDVAKNDVSLNVANYYLQVLANFSQIKIASVQIEQTIAQLKNIEPKVNAGLLPDLNLSELQAQLAKDSSTYYSAISAHQESVLQLKGLLNIGADIFFEIEIPEVEKIPIENLVELQPDIVYQTAKNTNPTARVNKLLSNLAFKKVNLAKAELLPTLSFGAGLGTNFSSQELYNSGVSFNGYSPITGLEPRVTVGSTSYFVQQPVFQFSQSKKNLKQYFEGYPSQLDQNFRQNVGITLNVPIFNNGTARFAYEKSKLDVKNQTLQTEQADNKLKNDIYSSYNAATTAFQKLNADKKGAEYAQKAYDHAVKRFETGLLSTFELITQQNNLQRASINYALSQYDYVFKVKVLEYYKGTGLKL